MTLGVAPDVTLGVAHGVTPSVAPGVAPGVTPCVAPGVAPGVTPSVAPGVANGGLCCCPSPSARYHSGHAPVLSGGL